jgi:hypothetical protein
MNQLECVAVASHLLLVAVAQMRLAKDYGADAGLVYLDTFDSIRRNRAFDQGVFFELLQLLRRLFGEEFLASKRMTEVGQIPGSGCGNCFGRFSELP